MKKYRILFIGNSDFGVPTLHKMVDCGWNIGCVLTSAEKYNIKKRTNVKTPIQEAGEKLGLPIINAGNDLKDQSLIEQIKSMGEFDLGVVIAFKMLPSEIYNIPKNGTINIHGSLLPDYRGAAPINWMIANGEKELGITAFLLDNKMDTGKIVAKHAINNNNNTFYSAYDTLRTRAAEFTMDAVKGFLDGSYQPYPQDDSLFVHKAPKLNRENTRIDFNKNCHEITNFINAFTYTPGAHCTIDSNDKNSKKSIKLFDAELAYSGACGSETPTFVVEDFGQGNELFLSVKGGLIRIGEVQIEGKKVMSSKEFINGYYDQLMNGEYDLV